MTTKDLNGRWLSTMQLCFKYPAPRDADAWDVKECPLCGRACWYNRMNGAAIRAACPNTAFVCGECYAASLQNYT